MAALQIEKKHTPNKKIFWSKLLIFQCIFRGRVLDLETSSFCILAMFVQIVAPIKTYI